MSEPYWVALAGGGVDYKGDWASGTAYKSGDVVRRNGIEYLAVNPSTGSIPPLAPSAAGVELAYAEITANVTVSATTAAAANTVVTAPAVTVDGATSVLIEFVAPFLRPPATAGGAIYLVVYDGSTQVGRLSEVSNPAAGTLDVPGYSSIKLTPAAGTHTYSVRSFVSAATGLVVAGVGGADPAWLPGFIRITTSQPIRMGVAIPPTYGTSLPSSPLDGQEAVLVDSLTNPSYQWRFRYNAGSASAYKWEFVGGATAYREIGTSESTSAGGLSDLATVGPSFTIPRAGDYDFSISAAVIPNQQISNLVIGLTLAPSTPIFSASTNAFGVNYFSVVSKAYRSLSRAAADVVKMQYATASGVPSFGSRVLTVTPVRVS